VVVVGSNRACQGQCHGQEITTLATQSCNMAWDRVLPRSCPPHPDTCELPAMHVPAEPGR
jgi:hypothetical protein